MNKKFLTLSVMALGAASILTGCQEKVSVESLVEDSTKILQDAKSMETNMLIDMEMTITTNGVNIDSKLNADLDIKTHNKSKTAYMEGEIEGDFLGMNKESELESYVVKNKDNEGYMVYNKIDSQDEEGEWDCSSVETSNYLEITDIYSKIKENLKDFTLKEETEKVEKIECFVIEGSLKGTSLENLMNSISKTNENINEDENLNYDKMLMNVKCYINKETKEPMLIEIDATEGFNNLTSGNFLGIETNFTKFAISISYDDFNEFEEIKVPQEIEKEASDNLNKELNNIYEKDGLQEDKFKDSKKVSKGKYLLDNSKLKSFVLNEKEFSLPMKVSDLMELGFEINEEEKDFIVNKDTNHSVMMKNKDSEIYVNIYNNTDKNLNIHECEIFGISIYSDSKGELDFSLSDINFKSTYKDIINSLGEPTSSYEGELIDSYYYETEDLKYTLDISINKETKEIYEIELVNYFMYN